ncbi:hypothetical protein J5N97_027551 [Dioscorea zingiberensis]|uniref:Uncharacterized protein n=1 Tax=Dioscorea zingiberensis TaxID=325984 RepID=A0A9D5C4X1_9LILI|nr:hypothetical protein J5N97_027551 [Dioscorea zingiberensis]
MRELYEERLECFRMLKYDVETDPPVAAESIKIYNAINDGTVNMVDKPLHHFSRPMEDYIKDAPTASVHKDKLADEKIAPPNVVLAIEYKSASEVEEVALPPPPPSEPVKEEAPV